MSNHSSTGAASRGTALAEHTANAVHIDIDAETRAKLATFVGQPALSDREIARFVGAPTGAIVRVFSGPAHPNTVFFLMNGGEQNGNSWLKAERELRRDASGALTMKNASLYIAPALRGGGIGTRIFAREVQALARAGVRAITTTASHGQTGTSNLNGYYTWARLGYDRTFDESELARLQLVGGITGVTTMQQLMRSPGGAAWWRAHGWEWTGTFDLHHGSVSRRVLAAYLRERGIHP